MKNHLRTALLMCSVAAALGDSPQLDLRALASLIGQHWRLGAGQRSGRFFGDLGGLGGLLGNSQVILTPKLEITSPNFPPDGGSFFLYADIPVSLGSTPASSRNDTVSTSTASGSSSSSSSSTSSSTSPSTTPSSSSGGDAPAPPPGDAPMNTRNPVFITSYGRRAARRDIDALPLSAGFHDLTAAVLAELGMDGRSCLLRAVCELAARPLRNNGLLGDLVNAAVEIPSTNDNKMAEELKVARQLGLSGAPCTEVFNNCDNMVINQLAK